MNITTLQRPTSLVEGVCQQLAELIRGGSADEERWLPAERSLAEKLGVSRTVVEQNLFRENGWALRVQASCDADTVRGNNFFGNSFDVSTNGHLVLNHFNANYWDKYEGYDLDRDGVGDVPYRPVGLYAVVVERMPYSLLLLRSFM
ncbi:MAG: GntR family transcriptional regulator, partial [Chthoniobacteraceae bacterium]